MQAAIINPNITLSLSTPLPTGPSILTAHARLLDSPHQHASPQAPQGRSNPEPPKRLSFKLFRQLANMPGLITATGVLAFLADDEPELKVFALQTLNDDIDTVWTEVAGALGQM